MQDELVRGLFLHDILPLHSLRNQLHCNADYSVVISGLCCVTSELSCLCGNVLLNSCKARVIETMLKTLVLLQTKNLTV